MKTLTLRIKREPFNLILIGFKNIEYRDIRPSNASRHVYFAHKGIVYRNLANIPDGCDVTVKPIKYDALRLINGYTKNAPELTVEVVDTQFYFLTDENNNDIIKTDKNGTEYYVSIIEYHLGEILSTLNV